MSFLLIRTLNFFMFPIIKFYWYIFKPKSTGVKVFIKYKDSVLIIKNSYGKQSWTLPGGGVKKNEDLKKAARREIKEEVDIDLDILESKGSFFYNGEHKRDTVHVFFAEVNNDHYKLNNFEIQDACWQEIKSFTLIKSPILKKCFKLVGYSQ